MLRRRERHELTEVHHDRRRRLGADEHAPVDAHTAHREPLHALLNVSACNRRAAVLGALVVGLAMAHTLFAMTLTIAHHYG